jgi:hypothetical protein
MIASEIAAPWQTNQDLFVTARRVRPASSLPASTLGIGLDRAQQGPGWAARTLGAALPLLDSPDTELIGGGELDLRHAGGQANGANVNLGRHVGRGVWVGGDLARDIAVRHRVDLLPVRGSQGVNRGPA